MNQLIIWKSKHGKDFVLNIRNMVTIERNDIDSEDGTIFLADGLQIEVANYDEFVEALKIER